MDKFSELVKLDLKVLKDKMGVLRKESLNLRFQKSSGQLEKTARISVVKKQIARIKTAINLIIKQNKEINKDFISDISASFQKTILNILDRKLKAVFGLMLERKINITQVALVGGVAKNKYIRKHVSNLLSKYNCSILLPPEFMLSDNAAMIGWSCIQKKYNNFNSDIYFQPDPRLKVTNNSL